MKALEINNFTKKYKENIAVDNISFDIEEGEFFGFLGPNGAGKTSTINCATGISKITSGCISVFGQDVVQDYREARKMIGLSPQEYNVDIWAPADKILWYVGGYYGMTGADRKKRIKELFDLFDLHKHRDKQFRALSGGLKRRIMLARALMHDPKLLILDEPTAGVDVELRHELWAYLKKINEQGKTILFTSHYLEEVENLCNRIAIINNGKIIALDNKEKFIENGSSLENTYLQLTKI
ncbi:MAG: ABC transporter ATP-binding protein [bacterium]|nr:ABC transporter ATP-binding protein [bacterium]